MDRIVVATADDDLRARLLEQLAEDGRVAACCTTWADTLARATAEPTRLLLIDGEMPGASGTLLDALRRAVPNAPDMRVVRGECAPLEGLKSHGQLRKLASEVVRPLSDRELRLLGLVGLGPEPMAVLKSLAASPLPVRIEGERGTGKQWIGRLVHRLAHEHRPFVVIRPGDEPTVRDSGPGTVYVENLEDHAPEVGLALLSLAGATGWRVIAGSRRGSESARASGWTQLHLRPLRERPKDVRPLVRHYLDDYRRRLGLPSRRVQAKLWERIERYPWPGNHRELETFVVQAATSGRGASLSVETLPRRVLDLLDADERERGERRAFEELVEARLRPVVDRYEPAPDAPSLYRLVIDATERALLRAALTRTAGNQKAAAELLGIARNTLRERIARLDPLDEAR